MKMHLYDLYHHSSLSGAAMIVSFRSCQINSSAQLCPVRRPSRYELFSHRPFHETACKVFKLSFAGLAAHSWQIEALSVATTGQDKLPPQYLLK